jgi:hypothetical protein
MTAAKATANLANAQLSTGPNNAKGKATSANNARTHDLTAVRLVLTTEDAAEYASLRNGLATSSLAPVGAQEQAAFDEYVNCFWRLQRCRRTEVAVLDDCINSILDSDPSLTPDQAIGRVFTTPDYQKKMSLFLRYQAAIERAVNRAHKQLTDMQRIRRDAEAHAHVIQACEPPMASFRSLTPAAPAVPPLAAAAAAAAGTPIQQPSSPSLFAVTGQPDVVQSLLS